MGRTGQLQIRFTAPVSDIESELIVRLPDDASAQLPSRGQVAVDGTVDGHEFSTVVEPDGRKGHWIRVDDSLPGAAGLRVGDQVKVALAVSPQWPEPQVPKDLATALSHAPEDIREAWLDITPMARWEWVRWVNATANPATRQRRVEVSLSKLEQGKRRPCCFDLASCTDPALATSGKLRVTE